jgi:hypothetical protein
VKDGRSEEAAAGVNRRKGEEGKIMNGKVENEMCVFSYGARTFFV